MHIFWMAFFTSPCLRQRSSVFVLAILLVLLIGYVDHITEWELSVFIFYALPIFLFARRGDLRMALLVAVLCGLAWYWANHGSQPYHSVSGYLWAAINRLAYFISVAIGGTALHDQREQMRARLEESERARALEQEIVRVSELEQMRIGQDLHDGLCQHLAAIDCAAACLKADLETETRPEAEAVGAIQQMLKDAVVEARNLARGISPVHAEADDLPAVLQELADTTNQRSGIEAVFTQYGEAVPLEPQTALHVYRIAQEAVRNAVKHAAAARVDITLNCKDDFLILTVADNGRGFAGTPNSKGMGVGSMRYRARLIGAELDIATGPQGGTTIQCKLSCQHADKS
jgi:signal transduction histidine kinase